MDESGNFTLFTHNSYTADPVIAEGFHSSGGELLTADGDGHRRGAAHLDVSENPAHRFRNGHRLPGGKHGRPNAHPHRRQRQRRGSARRASSKASNGVFGANISTRKSGSANSQTIFRASRYWASSVPR